MNELCFFTTNKRGGYFFRSNKDFSAYQGWTIFFEEPWELFKIVDRVQGNFKTTTSDKTLILEANESTKTIIDLDFRWIHEFCDKGRIYTVHKKDKYLIVKYEKYTDNDLKNKKYTKFLAIGGLENYKLKKEWIKKFYPYDSERKTTPELYVLRLLEGTAKKIMFGFGDTEEESIISSMVKPTQQHKKSELIKLEKQKKLYDEYEDAIIKADNAFSSCVKKNKNKEPMIFAGYPWFYQVWARDECISLTGLITQKRIEEAKNIIIRNLKRIKNGVLPNRFPESVLGSADGTGWLFQRIRIMIENKKDIFSEKELDLIKEKLNSFLDACKKKSYKGLVYSGPKETWMDTTTLNGEDTREGARIEIQALYLSALDLKLKLTQITQSENFTKHKHKLKKKKSLIRAQIINQDIICDGYINGKTDLVKRPNIFLAYYAYPKLATKKQWEKTFDLVLNNCWLDWGGLSSIEKSHPFFKDTYQGINNESYHRGDSWFFLNNIAAISMYQFNKEKYAKKIKKIKDASIHEMQNMGFLGYCAEVSSAKELSSKGCLSQAWSSATLLELLCKTNL